MHLCGPLYPQGNTPLTHKVPEVNAGPKFTVADVVVPITLASPVTDQVYALAPPTAVVEYVAEVLEHAKLLPEIGAGVLNAPRINLQLVFVTRN